MLRQLLYSLVVLTGTAQATIATSDTYRQCTQKVRTDPQSALREAEQWARRDNSAAANHCVAMAQFALKRYAQAAQTLEKLSGIITERNPALWANILRQAARAWELEPQPARAVTVLTRALAPLLEAEDAALARQASDLLVMRATLHAQAKHDGQAIQDLDHALSLSPGHENALLTRAAVFMAGKDRDAAQADLDALLAARPDHRQALALKKRLAASLP